MNAILPARLRSIWLLRLALLLPVYQSLGQVMVLHTGDGSPLTTITQPLFVDPSIRSPTLAFDVGFSTEETPQPNVFLDSFTLTLQDKNKTFTTVYLTVDASGFSWAPSASGPVLIFPESVARRAITFPNLDPSLLHNFAYTVQAPIPQELVGRPLTLYLDLFDNQNSLRSLAWTSGFSIIPEPETWTLALLGASVLLVMRRTQK